MANSNFNLSSLNGNNDTSDGIHFHASFSGSSVKVIDTDWSLADGNSDRLVGATVTITNLFNGVEESLSATTTGSITANYSNGVLTLSGRGTVDEYQQVLRSITYNNTAYVFDTTDRIINFVVDDGTAHSNNSTVAITTLTLNNPLIGLPIAILNDTPEDTEINITVPHLLVGLADPDTNDTLAVVNLTATNGTLVKKNDEIYIFTPTLNFNGTVTLNYDVTDGTTTLIGQTNSFSVISVNDAPVLTPASPFLPAVVPNKPNPGQTVASFVGSLIADVDADVLQGIAVIASTGNNGIWEYSINNGTSWISVGTVSGSSALLLRESDLIRFVPSSSQATITDTSLTYHAWDRSIGVAGDKVNITTTGGTSAFSSATDIVSLGTTQLGCNGTDTLTGNNGPDYLNGGKGNDRLKGGKGADTLIGSSGYDLLIGGKDADRLTGGQGADTFRFAFSDSLLSNFDRITDLQIGWDVIDGPNTVSAANLIELGTTSTLDAAGIGALLDDTNFVVNGAATFTFGSRTFLALNDSTAGFQDTSDAAIEITGFRGSLTSLAIA
ncbi:MAG: cadherin-like domain-containing protein [Nostoc sp. ChiSLP02]|nr:cadherin-like domain-containing protein [Nostoc sp. DedSLP05]MDZ8101495.1 cadherin-like domain-containing protein [Nostoc sp. DedSLP01]MDZ8186336.1 cadherin-like domain-containing protein [Nostoc sp. ChiSLP02]